MSPRVVGVDLSLTKTGVATPDGTQLIKEPTSQAAWPELRRMRWMLGRVVTAIDTAFPDPVAGAELLVVVEGLAYGSKSPHAMTRAGLWWMLIDHLDYDSNISYAVVSPAQRAKYATGSGNAGKDDVMREVTRRFPDFQGRNDEADALVLRAMGCDWLGTPLVAMPQTHRIALSKVDWPEVVTPVG